MKVIYIAGPYTSNKGIQGVVRNIRRAEYWAKQVWREGGVALCPHLNTALFDGLPDTALKTWLDGGLELLRRCDAILVQGPWKTSPGTMAEMALAKKLGKPVFNIEGPGEWHWEDLTKWLKEG